MGQWASIFLNDRSNVTYLPQSGVYMLKWAGPILDFQTFTWKWVLVYSQQSMGLASTKCGSTATPADMWGPWAYTWSHYFVDAD